MTLSGWGQAGLITLVMGVPALLMSLLAGIEVVPPFDRPWMVGCALVHGALCRLRHVVRVCNKQDTLWGTVRTAWGGREGGQWGWGPWMACGCLGARAGVPSTAGRVPCACGRRAAPLTYDCPGASCVPPAVGVIFAVLQYVVRCMLATAYHNVLALLL